MEQDTRDSDRSANITILSKVFAGLSCHETSFGFEKKIIIKKLIQKDESNITGNSKRTVCFSEVCTGIY